MMKKILVIGHSHIHALKTAKTVDETFDFYSLVTQGMKNLAQINANDYTSVIFSIVGNHHNIFGLLNHPEPFDFYLPEKINLPIIPNARLLPVSLVAKALECRMMPVFNITSTLLEFFKTNIYQIESVPPIPSEEHIKKYPGVFKEKINQLGVSPAGFRYKLWRLHSKIMRENCQKMGITFIEVPKESQDDDGLLSEKYWNVDPTHGNALYGDLVLNQIRAIHNMDIN